MTPTINLRQIEVFRAIMLSGSMVAAADLLSITQPSISRMLSQLEFRLGYALFERRGRRLVPTPEAGRLFEEIKQVYVGLERIARVAGDIRLQKTGALRIAVMPALSYWLLPQVTRRFLAQRPDVRLFVQSLPSREIVDRVASQQFDLGVVELPVQHPAVTAETLPAEPTVAVLPPEHPLTCETAISLNQLHGERMIALSAHTLSRYLLDDELSNAQVVPQVVIETPDSNMACAMAAAGQGIALVSEFSAAPFIPQGVAVRPLRERMDNHSALIRPALAPNNPLADAWVEQLKACFAALGNRQWG